MRIFAGTNVKITCQGRNYLGGTIGSDTFKDEYFRELVDKWVEQIKTLADIDKSQTQCAYSAFVGGFIHKLTYHLLVLKDISEMLIPF